MSWGRVVGLVLPFGALHCWIQRWLLGPCAPALPPLPSNPCSSVRGLTLRLADAELTPAAQGRQAIAVALPLLLETGGWGGWRCMARCRSLMP